MTCKQKCRIPVKIFFYLASINVPVIPAIFLLLKIKILVKVTYPYIHSDLIRLK